MLTYNRHREHASTKMTPHEARQNNNQLSVKFRLELKRQHSRKYPEISVGDTVRVFKKTKLDKERVSNYLPKKYKVEAIETSLGNQKFYKVEGLPRALMRSELLLIDE